MLGEYFAAPCIIEMLPTGLAVVPSTITSTLPFPLTISKGNPRLGFQYQNINTATFWTKECRCFGVHILGKQRTHKTQTNYTTEGLDTFKSDT
jgi:hypothetical protein